MTGRCRVTWGLGIVALTGCATNRPGIVARLPQPIADTRVLSTPGIAPPARRAPPKNAAAAPARRGWRPPGGISNRWDAIVIHHSASAGGNASRFDRYHRIANGWDELGYHFVIGNGNGSRDGEVEVGSRWLKQKHGAHCKTADNHFNDHGIGICLVGDFRARGPSRAQMASLVSLVRFLSASCNIPSENVVTHRGVTGKTECPGRRFPLYELRRSLAASTSGGVMP